MQNKGQIKYNAKDYIVSGDDFIDMMDHLIQTDYDELDFFDEIVSIEEVTSESLIDFNVSGNHLFYGNGVLTHNSAISQTDDVDNSSISDSLGTAMTSDFMMFLLQNEDMKEAGEIVCKITKNRFTGRTDTFMMNIDYEHMRFSDMLVQSDSSEILENLTSEALSNVAPDALDNDFGILTSEKQTKAEEFADQEVKDIIKEDYEKLKVQENSKVDPFSSSLDDIYADLGI